jgi:hypothetical protein
MAINIIDIPKDFFGNFSLSHCKVDFTHLTPGTDLDLSARLSAL